MTHGLITGQAPVLRSDGTTVSGDLLATGFPYFMWVDARSGEDANGALVAPGRFRQACSAGKQVLRAREIKFCSPQGRKRLLVRPIAH